MTTYIDTAIISALTSLNIPIVPLRYEGTADEYIVFNYDEIPLTAEGTSFGGRAIVQVHYYLPYRKNPNAMKHTIASALNSGGFTFPSIVNASDGDGQHYVFECETAVNSSGGI